MARAAESRVDWEPLEHWPRTRRLQQDSAIELTPLIDVTFLLLIFFTLTSALAVQQQVPMPEAVHGVGVDPLGATVITVLRPIRSPEASIYIGKVQPGAEVDLDTLRDSVQQGLAEGRTNVLLKAERQVPYRDVRRVAQAVKSIEGVKLHFGVRDRKQ